MTTAASTSGPRSDLLRRILGPFHIFGVFWYRFHLFGVRYAPAWTFWLLIPLFTTFFFFTLRRIRKAIAANYEVVMGPCGWWRRQGRIFRNLWIYAWCLTERYETLGTKRRVEPQQEGLETWQEFIDSGSGFVLVTAHIGHWEVGSIYPAEINDRKIHVVREAEIDEKSQEFFRELVGDRQRYTVHFANQAGNLGPKLLMALRRGEIVALQGDRPARGGRTVTVELFGQSVDVPVGPAAMARSAEVPILPVFIYRTGRRKSKLIFRPPILAPRTRDREADFQAVADGIAREVEIAISRDPYQWFCFTEMWPERREAGHS